MGEFNLNTTLLYRQRSNTEIELILKYASVFAWLISLFVISL